MRDPNADALTVLRRELTIDARNALAHLLDNAVCSVVCEVSMPTVDLTHIRSAVNNLRETIRQVLGESK